MQIQFLPASFDNDPRVTPARGDIAADWLDGFLKADKFVKPKKSVITATAANLYKNPDYRTGIETQLLYGETFDILEEKDDWVWGQSQTDGYVGYIKAENISPEKVTPTHQVINIGAWALDEADMKSRPMKQHSFGSLVEVIDYDDKFYLLSDHTYMFAGHLRALDEPDADPVGHAFRFLGVPYLWGGRSCAGIDCSALIQLCHAQCGISMPRDADMQQKSVGKALGTDFNAVSLVPGDLIFWQGHVGMMIDARNMIHANTRAMAVSIDELSEYAKFKGENERRPITAIKRIEL